LNYRVVLSLLLNSYKMPASKMSMEIDRAMTESVDMDQDYKPIVGDLHKFVLEQNVSGLQKFLFQVNGDEIWAFPDFANFFEQRDGLGRTPLQLALIKGLPTMVDALFDAANNVKSPAWRARITETMCKRNFKNLQRDTTPIIILALSAAVIKEEDHTDKAIECVEALMENTKALKYGEVAKDILKAKASFKRGVLHYAGQLGKNRLIVFLIALHKEFMLLEAAMLEECTARKLPLHYAIDSNDKDSIKTVFTETLGTKNKDLKEKLTVRIARYCVRRSLFLYFDV